MKFQSWASDSSNPVFSLQSSPCPKENRADSQTTSVLGAGKLGCECWPGSQGSVSWYSWGHMCWDVSLEATEGGRAAHIPAHPHCLVAPATSLFPP